MNPNRPTAAPARWPYIGHRTLEQVCRDNERLRLLRANRREFGKETGE